MAAAVDATVPVRTVVVALRLRALTCAIVALAVGCGEVVAPEFTPPTRDVAPLFQTDSLAYTMRRVGSVNTVTIGVTFVNRTSDTAYIPNCHGASSMRLDKLVGDEWRPAWSPVVSLCLSAPIVVGVGATYTTQIFASGGDLGSNTAPQFAFPEIDGEYRFVWLSLQTDPEPESGNLFPFETRVSNRFRLSVSP
jgi:hypothetical protein